jgi:hypothetical protein
VDGPHPLQVGFPAAFGTIIGMAHIVAHPGAFATNLTQIGHSAHSFAIQENLKQNLKKNKGRT